MHTCAYLAMQCCTQYIRGSARQAAAGPWGLQQAIQLCPWSGDPVLNRYCCMHSRGSLYTHTCKHLAVQCCIQYMPGPLRPLQWVLEKTTRKPLSCVPGRRTLVKQVCCMILSQSPINPPAYVPIMNFELVRSLLTCCSRRLCYRHQ